MNFQTILEELDRLYEEDTAKGVKEAEEAEEVKEEKEPLTEAADEEVAEEPVEEEDVDEPEAEEAVIEVEDDQLVLECSKCGALFIKAEDEVSVDDETSRANMDDACQYCEETAGYKVIGTFSPYAVEEDVEEAEAPEEPEEVEEPVAEEPVEEGLLDLDLPVTANVNVRADGNNVPFLNTGMGI